MGNRRTAERPARHLNAGSWLVLAIGYLVAEVIYTLLAFQQLTDGWYYNTDDGVTVEFSQGRGAAATRRSGHRRRRPLARRRL